MKVIIIIFFGKYTDSLFITKFYLSIITFYILQIKKITAHLLLVFYLWASTQNWNNFQQFSRWQFVRISSIIIGMKKISFIQTKSILENKKNILPTVFIDEILVSLKTMCKNPSLQSVCKVKIKNCKEKVQDRSACKKLLKEAKARPKL